MVEQTNYPQQTWSKLGQCLEQETSKKPRGALIKGMLKKAKYIHVLENWTARVGLGKPPINMLGAIRPLLALKPLDDELQKSGKEILREWNSVELNKLADISKVSDDAVIVVIGCRTRYKKLLNTVNRLTEQRHGFKVIGIIGKGRGPDWAIKTNRKNGILTVPCRDSYEALPEKILWMCLAINLLDSSLAIIKVDDDTKAVRGEKIKRLLKTTLLQGNDAAGLPISIASPLAVDRGWHIGKSNGKHNWTAFQGLAPKRWMSGGAGYLLQKQAVSELANFALHSWEYIKNELYEDLAVSHILQSCGKSIYWVNNCEELGLRNERINEIEEKQRQFNASSAGEK